MQEKLNKLVSEVSEKIARAETLDVLQIVEIECLGRKGALTLLFKELSKLSPAERGDTGQQLNAVKQKLTTLILEKQKRLQETGLRKSLEEDWVDITAPGTQKETGHIHPLAQVQYDVEQIFAGMGFTVVDGPEVESEYYNFEGLNIPSWHPARDMQDTFFVESEPDKKHGQLVLRTHTSPTGQVRAMEKFGAPLRVIAPGRCFRNEATDARHEHTFDQVEGMLIDKNISLAHLKGVMQEFLTRLFGRPMKIRFRPGYFPFVEPGIELDISCTLCDAAGCRVCKHTGWIEFMGAGMTHPNVLRLGGIDPDKFQGWAFGFGITRLTMMKFGIDDIRLLCGGDLRFLQQF